MSVSIVIVTYGTRKSLRDCLQSIQVNSVSDQETIVVDNHSLDDSVAMVRTEFPEVRLIANEENLGFSKANNYGIRAASGEYVLLLNSDTVVLPGALQTMTEFMVGHPEAGAIGCRLRSADGSIQASAGRHERLGLTPLFFRLSGISQLIRSARARRFVRQHFGFAFGRRLRACLDAYVAGDSPLEVETLSGACLMLRRAAIAQVGGLDENFFMYLEDLDYCIRLREAGWKLYYLPAVHIIHLGEASSGGRMRRQSVRTYESLFYFYGKHYSVWTVRLARFMVLVVFGLRWMWTLASSYLSEHRFDEPDRSDLAKVIHLCWNGGDTEWRSGATDHACGQHHEDEHRRDERQCGLKVHRVLGWRKQSKEEAPR
jgi:GT2 family glycosyltransferase